MVGKLKEDFIAKEFRVYVFLSTAASDWTFQN